MLAVSKLWCWGMLAVLLASAPVLARDQSPLFDAVRIDEKPEPSAEDYKQALDQIMAPRKTVKRQKADEKTGEAPQVMEDQTIAAPIPEDAVLPDAEKQKADAVDRAVAGVMKAPVVMGGPTMLRSAPVAAALARYQFLPLLPQSADPMAMPMLWPLLTSQKLAASHALVRRAVIVIHDITRDADAALRETQVLAGPVATGPQAPTIIIAPMFPIKPDRAIFKPLLTDAIKHVAVWDSEGWWQGAETLAAENGDRRVSSMTAMDLLLLSLADRKHYPMLQEVVIAGYGRGADFVQRYALFGRAHDILTEQQLAVSYVVAAAQSYAYLTDVRPGNLAGAFATPKDVKVCPDYQNYPYGLEQPNDYTRLTAGNMARLHYAERSVTYLTGGDDVAPAADQACGAAWQGNSVKDRAVNYFSFLKSNFGDVPRQRLLVLPGVKDDGLGLLTSACGTSLLFSDGECLRAEEPQR